MTERPDPNKLCIDDMFYKVERETTFSRQKKYRTIDGEEWYKYCKPRSSYNLVEYTVIGILQKDLIGVWDTSEQYELLTQYYFRTSSDSDKSFTTDADWFSNYNDELFLDKDEAMTYIEQKYAEDRVKDRT